MTRFTRTALAAAVLGAVALPSMAGPRAYVASYGNDANVATGCLFASPCRGFTAAHSAVDAGGEIVALDAAGYGSVVIAKSVTITANPGYFAGIAASTGSAITIGTPGVNVTLRGLNINGIGAATGINMTAGARLNVENCVISNFTSDGVRVSDVPDVRILNTLVRGNGGSGLVLRDGVEATVANSQFLDNTVIGLLVHPPAATAFVTVNDSIAAGNGYGFVAAGAGRMTLMRVTASNNINSGVHAQDVSYGVVGYSQVVHHNVGLYQSGQATLESMGNNLLRANIVNTQGVITLVGGG